MPRQARLDAPGTLHHVMLRGIERRAIVTDNADRHEFVSRLRASAMQSRTSVYGWALLTNHAHLLLCSGPDGLPRLMRRFLTGYAQAYNRRHQRHGLSPFRIATSPLCARRTAILWSYSATSISILCVPGWSGP